MMDDADHAGFLEEAEKRNGIFHATAPLRRQGSEFCIDCGDRIMKARRKALPSAERCIECEENLNGVGR
jgi:RNA polymerase-binding transcription factor DksA